MAGFGSSGSVASLSTQLFVPTGPQVEKVPPAPCQQSQGREFCQAVCCDSQPLCHFSETSHPPPPNASGENKADSQVLRGGRESAQCIQGSSNPTDQPPWGGGVSDWKVRELLTRACGGPWRQFSRLPLVSSQPRTHKYLSWGSKGYLRSPLGIQLASGVA